MSQRLSSRTAWDASENSYAAAVRAARGSGRTVYDLTLSNPTRCGFCYDANTLLLPLTDARGLTYDPDPRGTLSARDAVSRYYADHSVAADSNALVLTTSTSESYSFLFRLLCDPGDEVLVAQPSYPLFDFLATLDNVRLVSYPLFYDHGWWIDFAELERRISPRTRAIMVVHPNNPTGHWTRSAERIRLEEICHQRGLALIVDEVFLDYPLDESKAEPSFSTGSHEILTFVLSGLSKICGLPQMKAAWILTLGPADLRIEALKRLEIIADTFLSMNALVQLALPSWLAGRHVVQDQILARARTNLAILKSFAAAEPGRIGVLETSAGWSAILALPQCVGSSDCAEGLALQRGVIVHPCSFYGMAESSRVVVSLIGPSEALRDGIYRTTGVSSRSAL